MRQMTRPSGEAGFSLLEMIVAVAVTMVVTGAVYGLVSSGNSAFRREPELTDRQQNARVAMDMMQRDIAIAGTNLGPFFQAFSRGQNGVGRLTGPGGQRADHLEVFGNDGTCPDAPAKNGPCPGNDCAYNGDNIVTGAEIPDCYGEDSLTLVLFSNGGAKWGVGHNKHAGDQKFNFPGGQNPPQSQIQGPGDLQEYRPGDGSRPVALSPLNLIRYEIGFDPPAAAETPTSVPALYRSATGGMDPTTGAFHTPTTAADIIAGHWTLLARGVEDLQVQYRDGNGAWTDQPAIVTCAGLCKTPTAAEYNTATREVRVTMSVRAEGYNLQGQTSSGASSRANAVRGSVTTVTSVKALQNYLAAIPPTLACPECPVWR